MLIAPQGPTVPPIFKAGGLSPLPEKSAPPPSAAGGRFAILDPRCAPGSWLSIIETKEMDMNTFRKSNALYVVVAIAIAVKLGVAVYAVITGTDLAGSDVPVQVNRTLLF